MAKKRWEVADVDANGDIVTRGGIYTHRKAEAQEWADANNRLLDCHCIVIEADDNAITWDEYIRECEAEIERIKKNKDSAEADFIHLFEDLD